MTDIWGPAHRPNLDGALLIWGGLCGGSQGPSQGTILYVALHLTQLLPDLKQGGQFTQAPASHMHTEAVPHTPTQGHGGLLWKHDIRVL